MQKLSCEEILAATGGSLVCGNLGTDFSNISTDSRKVGFNELFIPIVGEKFDGHDYIISSLEMGASGALTQVDTGFYEGKVIIRVENTLKALQDIARYYRSKFSIPVVGITGSVGKTSTKDMVACTIATRLNVHKTEGNFNNEIGMPLTVFKLDQGHEAAVFEMGMSGFGEISRLTSIAKPDIAIITNIGMSHIEKLGSRVNIMKAKLEILEGLAEKGLVVLNGDDDMLSSLKGSLPFETVFYGINGIYEYQARNIDNLGENGTRFDIELEQKVYTVYVPVPGLHNVYNALAAIAAGKRLGIPVESMIEGIRAFSPGKMRLNIITNNGIKIIDDAYNASPQSMEAAICVLKDISGASRKIAVLGDMLEMGDFAPEAHRRVGRFAAQKGLETVVTVGENARYIAEGAAESAETAEVLSFEDNAEVCAFLKNYLISGDVVLVKGSRGMKMEQIVESLKS
ncbi:MAG: UDP-N-acetylmuramoyl-tripeptide--D-alanyl-D-alanine ligase [Bacillota bacterium]|nr:UDP-N-acetylmuramoyl-tripeptide--D-alanyl-D-alanine ligase [Bacillota bacterium]